MVIKKCIFGYTVASNIKVILNATTKMAIAKTTVSIIRLKMYGAIVEVNNMPKIKFWGNKQVNKIVSFVSNTKINDASCGFRAYSRDTLLSLNLHGSFTYTHETILDLLNKTQIIV